MTLSARARMESGILKPSLAAVLRFTVSSNATGCSTGRSAGLSVIDPLERETSALVGAQQLGLDRTEYNKSEALSTEVCPLNSNFNSCHDSMMKTGGSNLPDFK
jgi:hypothetical protein